MNKNSEKLKALTIDVKPLQDTSVVQDIKYQDIMYYKNDIYEVIEASSDIPIDFLKAMSEMEKLDWTYSPNYIGFLNKRTNECVQFIRIAANHWYVENVIDHGDNWDGYFWKSETDNKTVSAMMRLFFEEMPWFGILSWKLMRSRSQ